MHSPRTSLTGPDRTCGRPPCNGAAWAALVVSIATLPAPAALTAAEVTSAGKVTHVTLYRDQAMVTRTIVLDGDPGAFELIVPGLPEQLNPDSMFAEGDDAVDVRAVEFRSRAVLETPRDDIRALENTLAELQRQATLVTRKTELAAKRQEYLDKLEAFVAPTASVELTQGVLDAEALQKITQFNFEQRTQIALEQVELEGELAELQEKITLTQRQLNELTNGEKKTLREAIIYLQKRGPEPRDVRLNYLVQSCGWSPSYVLRGEGGREAVGVEYNGLIRQLSGEDWNDVVLTLSTASPALSAAGPALAPFHVTLTPPQQQQAEQLAEQAVPLGKGADLYQQLRSIRDRQSSALLMNQNSMNLDDNNKSSWTINGAVNDLQCLEITADRAQVQTLAMESPKVSEGPSLSYRLAAPVTLQSRRDQQMVRIMNSEFASRFYHVATPLLTSYVYREAELTNDSQEDLLNGPITVYLDGRFVGRSEIPTVARGQTLVVGFGADPQLRTRRELADRSEGIQGGNRELTFTYRLVVENYKNEPVAVRVVDRLPNADRESEIRVRLAETEESLSDDKVYNRLERPQGILRWDVEAPAGATGESARLISYTYTVEHDRTYRLATPANSDALLKEFENLQRQRNRR